MKIVLITPAYATTTTKAAVTPVVHYFAKEWVKQGHDVRVFCFDTKFPAFYYWVSRVIKNRLYSLLGYSISINPPQMSDSIEDGVNVHFRYVKKYKPHGRLSKRQVLHCLKEIDSYCKSNVPDVFIGHWVSPTFEVLPLLGQKYKRPTALVLHNNTFDIVKSIGPDLDNALKKIDIIGFRNKTAISNFESAFWTPPKYFFAYSGVSDYFLTEGLKCAPKTVEKPFSYVFVGSLIDRKYPVEILDALVNVHKDGNFELTYIGDGNCSKTIIERYESYNRIGTVKLTGRLKREDIADYLKKADVFIMISKGEIFGLVYLEAMAFGLIPIASKNEGMDGIIEDGVNGYLCEAGNVRELSDIIRKIESLTPEQFLSISDRAKKTALSFSDSAVAESYISQIEKYIKNE